MTCSSRLGSPLSAADEKIVTATMDCGFAVHRAIGPGYREKVYSNAFCLELDASGLRFEVEKTVPVKHRDRIVGTHKIDMIVERVVLVELKAVPRLRPLYKAQVLSYLKTTGLRVGC